MKSNQDANNHPVFILMIGIILLFSGAAGSVVLFIQGINLWLILTALLFVIGVIIIIYGAKRAKDIKALKILLANPNAHETTAKFVKSVFSSYSSTSVGNGSINVPTSVNVYKKVIYTYTDQHGVSHTAKSTLSYYPDQVKYLQNLGTFKIKCDGAVSAITEELPQSNKLFNV